MVILGIPFMMSFNQSACLLVDGEIIGWTEEERLSRNKHSIVLRNNRPPSICKASKSINSLKGVSSLAPNISSKLFFTINTGCPFFFPSAKHEEVFWFNNWNLVGLLPQVLSWNQEYLLRFRHPAQFLYLIV